MLTTLPASLASMSETLMLLWLSQNLLAALPSVLFALTNLRHLNIAENNLTELSSEMARLTNLELLISNSNEICSIPHEMSACGNLAYIDVNHCRITSLPENLCTWTKLHELKARNNAFVSIPVFIDRLTNLKNLDLHANLVSSIPDGIGRASSLKGIDLEFNAVQNLNSNLSHLTQLNSLKVEGNALRAFDDDLIAQCSMVELFLAANHLSHAPRGLFQHTNLDKLTLSDNLLTAMPMGLGALTRLRSLEVYNNTEIDTLPSDLGELRSLELLHVQSNMIQSIPELVVQIASLKRMDFRHNLIVMLPATLPRLSQLSELAVSGNAITLFPFNIPEYASLEAIWLGNNRISTQLTPEFVARILERQPTLKSVNARGNAIVLADGAQHVCARASSDILALNSYAMDEWVAQTPGARSCSAWLQKSSVFECPNVTFVSIGFACQPAIALRRFRGAAVSGSFPFDFIDADMTTVLELFATRFADIRNVFQTKIGWRNLCNDVLHTHDDFQNQYERESKKYERAARRLIALLESGVPVILMRMAGKEETHEFEQLKILCEFLMCTYPRAHFQVALISKRCRKRKDTTRRLFWVPHEDLVSGALFC